LARGVDYDNPADAFGRESLHPLSRFRFDFGLGRLELVAVRVAGAYSESVDDAAAVIELVRPLLQSAEESHRVAGANAILALKPQLRPTLAVADLARHPSPSLRGLAVELWSADPSAMPELAQRFLTDAAPKIRGRLGDKLQLIAESDGTLADGLRTSYSVILARTCGRLPGSLRLDRMHRKMRNDYRANRGCDRRDVRGIARVKHWLGGYRADKNRPRKSRTAQHAKQATSTRPASR
jgi:hypothetical protein